MRLPAATGVVGASFRAFRRLVVRVVTINIADWPACRRDTLLTKISTVVPVQWIRIVVLGPLEGRRRPVRFGSAADAGNGHPEHQQLTVVVVVVIVGRRQALG